jgi:antitoxin component YwqK of YwqJK toxin-antitoxin module
MKKLLLLCSLFLLFGTVRAYCQDMEGDRGHTYYDAEKKKPKETYAYEEVTHMGHDEDGKPVQTVTYRKNGPYFYYYENGKLKVSGEYRSDKKSGTWRYYDETGKEIKVEKYENDVLVK